jgi:hypothetical protein
MNLPKLHAPNKANFHAQHDNGHLSDKTVVLPSQFYPIIHDNAVHLKFADGTTAELPPQTKPTERRVTYVTFQATTPYSGLASVRFFQLPSNPRTDLTNLFTRDAVPAAGKSFAGTWRLADIQPHLETVAKALGITRASGVESLLRWAETAGHQLPLREGLYLGGVTSARIYENHGGGRCCAKGPRPGDGHY